MSKIGIPQALPPPVDFFKTFTPSINKNKTSKPSISNPKPIPLDFFNKVRTRSMNSSSKKQTPIIKRKCPKGTRKNRQTKVCESMSVIRFRTKRKYTRGLNKKCPKGTHRNKLTNNCDQK